MTVVDSAHPVSSPLASTSQHTLNEVPLREKRRQLKVAQGQLVEIQHAKEQLERLSQGTASSHASQSDLHTAGWTVRPDTKDGHLASEMKDGKLLVPLGRLAFLPAKVKGQTVDDTATESVEDPVVYIRAADEPMGNNAAPLYSLVDLKHLEGYEQMTVSRALAYLAVKRGEVERRAASLRENVVNLARQTLADHLSGNGELSNDGVASLNAEGQAINEEGLPFVDPVEPLSDNTLADLVPPLPSFRRTEMSKEARKELMDSLFSQLEAEEGTVSSEKIAETIPSSIASGRKDVRPASHRRVSSADRPPPVKSVLKQTAPVPPPLPRFGSSGIRRGFLNLNPSSPAAERSSDPIQSYNLGQPLTRSNSAAAESTASAASDDSTTEDRMSRSVELSSKNPRAQQRKKKKTVRIQSPVREMAAPNSPHVANEVDGINGGNRDDFKEEAKTILELLGVEAIKDHPQAGGLYKALKESEDLKERTHNSESARAAVKRSEKENLQKPAVSQSVMERSSPVSTSQNTLSDKARNTDGFKRGFLNGNSPIAVPNAPRVSQGISALERATQSDKDLEEKREAEGLKPTVPHARPSKAFAAKLEAKKQGKSLPKERQDDDQSVDPGIDRKSRVRFGEDDKGEVQVQVGTAASPASGILTIETAAQDENDGSLETTGMQIYNDDLDEETVEALGYFSDEDYDPDVGWDEDDLQLSRPSFSADAESISNVELRKEYERIKASLGSRQDHNDGRYEGDESNGFVEGADLSMQDDDEDDDQKPKVSRFKQDRAKRKLQGQTMKSNELGTGLNEAVNAGPSMLIPSIANVRYSKSGQSEVEGHEIQLDGQSDDEDGLEEVMRQRLIQYENKIDKSPSTSSIKAATAPPTILTSKSIEVSQPVPKRTSLFKTRMKKIGLDE